MLMDIAVSWNMANAFMSPYMSFKNWMDYQSKLRRLWTAFVHKFTMFQESDHHFHRKFYHLSRLWVILNSIVLQLFRGYNVYITTCKCNTVLKWFDASKKESIANALKQEILLYEVTVPIDQRVPPPPPFSFFRVENQAHLPRVHRHQLNICSWRVVDLQHRSP